MHFKHTELRQPSNENEAWKTQLRKHFSSSGKILRPQSVGTLKYQSHLIHYTEVLEVFHSREKFIHIYCKWHNREKQKIKQIWRELVGISCGF